MVGIYRFAERIVRIDSLFERVHRYCQDYVYEKTDSTSIDIFVKIRQEELDFERSRTDEDKKYPYDYLEELAVYRQIAEKMPFYDTFLFHGSAVAVDGKAYLFTAPSGTGKSTHVRLWRELLGDRAVMVNDDKPLIRIKGEEVLIYGTPWNGKHRLGENICVPLIAVCVLERAETNRIEPISSNEAYPVLLQQTYRPMDRETLRRTLVLLDKFRSQVRFFRLQCNMDPEAAKVSYEGVQ